MLLGIFVILATLYLIVLAFIMKVENFRSTIVFKVIPFIVGLGLLISWILKYYAIPI